LITGFADAIALPTGREAKDIAAGRIFDFDGDGGGGQLADIARIAKMIEKKIAIHLRFRILLLWLHLHPGRRWLWWRR